MSALLPLIAGLGGGSAAGIGTLLSAGATILGGVASASAASAEAASAERKAQEEKATSQRNAEEKAKETQLLLSRSQAVAAASGAGASDPTVLKLTSGIAGEGEYQAEGIRYEGDAAAAGDLDQAAALRSRARQDMLSGFLDAGTSLLSGNNDWGKYRSRYTKPQPQAYGF